MMIYFLLFSLVVVLVLSIGLITNRIHPRFMRIAHFYNFLFFGFLLLSVYHQITFLLSDDESADGNISEIESEREEIISNEKMKEEVLLDAPLIKQLPELPRGCEVTSLAMLLGFAGLEVDKMELAKEVEKDSTPYQVSDGKIYFGNPNDGFVGDMYNIDQPGYGVYHEPVIRLAEKYLPCKIVNLTEKSFEELQLYLSHDVPIWVIINTTYQALPEKYFQKWETPTGPVNITYKEHAVLITGYNKDAVFVNDPLTGVKNKKVQKEDFIKAWSQMGSQAITILPK